MIKDHFVCFDPVSDRLEAALSFFFFFPFFSFFLFFFFFFVFTTPSLSERGGNLRLVGWGRGAGVGGWGAGSS